jgi:hypothetical protein
MSGIPEANLTFFQEQIDDFFTLGSGEELIAMTPEELRIAINKYLDRGVNFIKYGGSTEAGPPYLILFSPRGSAHASRECHKTDRCRRDHLSWRRHAVIRSSRRSTRISS